MEEQRFIDLESKIAHQEHLLASLNETVTKQELELHQLRESMATLAKRLKELVEEGPATAPANEKPPHW